MAYTYLSLTPFTFLLLLSNKVVEVLNGRMGATLPTSLDQVDYYEVGSPLTFAHYYNSEQGAFYGLDNDMKRFEPRNFFLRLRRCT